MLKSLIKIDEIYKEYEVAQNQKVKALNGVSLELKQNEFVCIIGPSGCGKTTLLNIIAGLEPFDKGKISMLEKDIIGPGPERGVIFQQYALFPWMSVRKNIEYGMKFLRKKSPNGRDIPYSKEEKQTLADIYIKMVNLTGFENSYPKQLSGGMKQRVAIARAYALNPEVLLMDEPFGALDAQTRTQLQEDLLQTWEREKKTCVFITHDVEEAVLLATRVVIMTARPGSIKEIVDIKLPYPRDQETKMDKEYIHLKNYIWGIVYKLYLEIRA